jgi:hypothetical protein
MKIKTKLKDLAGKELDLTIGKAISDILLASEAGGKMKLFILAQKFYSDETIDLDKVDLGLVKEAIETSKVYLPLVTGQLLVLLDDIK